MERRRIQEFSGNTEEFDVIAEAKDGNPELIYLRQTILFINIQ